MMGSFSDWISLFFKVFWLLLAAFFAGFITAIGTM